MEKFKKYYQNHKNIVIAISCVALTAVLIFLFCTVGYIDVSVTMGEKTQTVKIIRGQSAGIAVAKTNFPLAYNCALSVVSSTPLFSPTSIEIIEPREILVGNHESIVKIRTPLTEKKDIFRQAGIEYDEEKNTYFSDDYNSCIYYQLSENEEIVEGTSKIKYKTITTDDPGMQIGTSKTLTNGKNGKAKTITLVTRGKKGKIIKKNLLLSQTISEAVNKEILLGSKPITINTNGRSYTSYKSVTVEATGYCSCKICCGPYNGSRTANGSKTTMYHTVAAPASYDFGTMLYIPYFDSSPNGGIFEVEDRGGAIQGNRIDIYFSTHERALQFGRRTLKVYIIK